jgi:ankyrin repeat protein
VHVIKALIDRGADLGLQEQEKQRTALHLAAHEGQAEAAAELLKRGAIVNAIDKYEMTPLMVASKCGHAGVVKVRTVLCTVYCVLCTVYCALCTVHCALCTVYCTLLFIQY